MKKHLILVFVSLLIGSAVFAQSQYPPCFSYEDYVTPARNQLVQGPCLVHATMAGIEAMYNLYYGDNQDIDLSERALFSCCREGDKYEKLLSGVIEYAEENGVIDEIFMKYPPSKIPCDENINKDLWNIIFDKTINYQTLLKDNKTRFKIEAMDVDIDDNEPNYNDTIKKYLLSYGPIIFKYSTGDFHAMLLIGWNNNSWIVKDSYPCKDTITRTIPFGGPYINMPGSSYTMFEEAYVIKSITKQKYDKDKWSDVAPPTKQYVSLEPFLKIQKIYTPDPLCYNQGIQYEVSGLNQLLNAECTGWSYTASNGSVNLSVSDNNKKCIVTGNATGVTLYATIERHTGIMEKIAKDIGNIGLTSRLVTINGHCAGSNYEITSKIEHPFIAETIKYKYNIPTASNGSYYAIQNGQYAYWVFKTPNVVRYSATITAEKTDCPSISNTHTAIIYSTWCGYSYKSAVDGEASDSIQKLNDLEAFDKENLDENSPLVIPNPATNDLTLTHIGEGINDIRIYDLTGSLVYSIKTEETKTINVSMIPRGIYIVRYVAEGATNQVKPIKIVLE